MRSGPLIWFSLAIAVVVIVFGVVSIFAVPKQAWQAADRRRWRWVLMMFAFGPLAVLLFYGTVRQQMLHPERYVTVDGVAPADR